MHSWVEVASNAFAAIFRETEPTFAVVQFQFLREQRRSNEARVNGA
jgi:hypothetical protein